MRAVFFLKSVKNIFLNIFYICNVDNILGHIKEYYNLKYGFILCNNIDKYILFKYIYIFLIYNYQKSFYSVIYYMKLIRVYLVADYFTVPRYIPAARGGHLEVKENADKFVIILQKYLKII